MKMIPKILLQFVKFGLVGISNTFISYAVEMGIYYVIWPETEEVQIARVLVATSVAFVISVTNSYFWNSGYVFKNNQRQTPKQHLNAYGKTLLCYGFTGLVLAPVLKVWLTTLSVPYWAAGLVSLTLSIPINFLLNKFWAFN